MESAFFYHKTDLIVEFLDRGVTGSAQRYYGPTATGERRPHSAGCSKRLWICTALQLLILGKMAAFLPQYKLLSYGI